MRFRLDKWYLDCQADGEFGYYYVSRLQIGGLRLLSAEINHRSPDGEMNSSRIGLARDRSPRELHGADAIFRPGRIRSELRIDSDAGCLTGTWRSLSGPLPRRSRPLYRCDAGWCDWKVWSPCSEVELMLPPGTNGPIHGTGYIDLVRLAIPFWRLPFRNLLWGRLHSGDRWIVLYQLETADSTCSWMADDSGREEDVEVRLVREESGWVSHFEWRLDSNRIEAEVRESLHSGPIINRKRISRWLPQPVLSALGSGGIEAKYWVAARIDGDEFTGPMEEVRWHES
jgi:hypothetical protein